MKAITEYTKEEYAEMRNKSVALFAAIRDYNRSDLITVERRRGYAHYTFSGRYTDKLVEVLGHQPDADEIIMIVDDGYSHFGASCSINRTTKTFTGRVNID